MNLFLATCMCEGLGLSCSVELVHLNVIFQVIVLVVSIIFVNGSSANPITITKVITQLDKWLNKWYLNEGKIYIIQIGLMFAVDFTVIAQVFTLENAVGMWNANMHHKICKQILGTNNTELKLIWRNRK